MKRNLWAAYITIAIFGGALVIAVWIMSASLVDRVREWWRGGK